ncbi:DUF4231 domain-containing protein [Desulfobulbus sp. TB]|nr:DUF4231 domain-containing protein [Desulfobulbus sp. TB]
MKKDDFPQVYVLASAKSGKQQTLHLCLLRIQFIFLFFASSTTVLSSCSPVPLGIASAVYLVFVIMSLAALCYSVKMTPEKIWYESRALTESVKTITWRFIMEAEPFNSDHTDEQLESHFTGELNRIWELNEMDDKEIDDTLKETPQVTEWMKNVRNSSFKEKKCRYCNSRIQSQLNWYQQKAELNKNRSRFFSAFSIAIYLFAIAVACWQLIAPSSHIPKWFSEPLLVMAAGLLGWTQAKRYSELASSYSLTAREISRLQKRMADVTEEQFGDFVNDAETAFSREHTQWAARQIKIIAEKPDNSAQQAQMSTRKPDTCSV